MSEHAEYNVVRKDLNNIRAATLKPFNEGWAQPTWEEVRSVLVIAGKHVGKDKLTGKQAANLVGVNPRQVRKWTAPPDSSNFAPIPYAPWRLLIEFCGIADKVNTDTLSMVADR